MVIAESSLSKISTPEKCHLSVIKKEK